MSRLKITAIDQDRIDICRDVLENGKIVYPCLSYTEALRFQSGFNRTIKKVKNRYNNWKDGKKGALLTPEEQEICKELIDLFDSVIVRARKTDKVTIPGKKELITIQDERGEIIIESRLSNRERDALKDMKERNNEIVDDDFMKECLDRVDISELLKNPKDIDDEG